MEGGFVAARTENGAIYMKGSANHATRVGSKYDFNASLHSSTYGNGTAARVSMMRFI